MDLILKRSCSYKSFLSEWLDKWAPAILKYCKHSERRDIKAMLQSFDDEGMLVPFC